MTLVTWSFKKGNKIDKNNSFRNRQIGSGKVDRFFRKEYFEKYMVEKVFKAKETFDLMDVFNTDRSINLIGRFMKEEE